MFRLSYLKYRRFRIAREFSKKYRALKEAGGSTHDYENLTADEYYSTKDIEEAIDYAVSEKLLDKARSLDVDIPSIDDPVMWDKDDDQTFKWLSPKGRAQVRKGIDEEKARRFDVKTRWVTKIILPLAGVLVGVIGAITGLVAVLHRK